MYRTKYRIILLLEIVCVILLCSCNNKADYTRNYFVEETVAPTVMPTETPSFIPIFRTVTGECYHRGDCFYLESKISVTPEDAIRRNLRACSVCKSSEIKNGAN